MVCKKLRLLLILCMFTSASTVAQTDADWRQVRSAAGRFSIDFPCNPEIETKTVRSGAGSVVQNNYKCAGANGFFLVTYSDYPNLGATDKARLDITRDSIVQAASGRLMSESSVRLAARHPGREFDFTAVNPAGAFFFRTRAFLVRPRRIYTLMVGSSRERWSDSDATKFLLSFALSK